MLALNQPLVVLTVDEAELLVEKLRQVFYTEIKEWAGTPLFRVYFVRDVRRKEQE